MRRRYLGIILITFLLIFMMGCSSNSQLSASSTATASPTTVDPGHTLAPPPIAGAWLPNEDYGVNGKYAEDNLESSVLDRQMHKVKADPTDVEFMLAADVRIKVENWTYYFDTRNPVANDEEFIEFPICRKNDSGGVQRLGISGFEMVASSKYLYVKRNLSSGDFVHWALFRVTLDGKRKVFCGGDAIDLFIPLTGNYMYFSSHDWSLCRTDHSFERVEEIFPAITDKVAIIEAINPNFVDCEAYDLKGDLLYFGIFAYNIFDGGSYSGNYTMNLLNGQTQKLDKGDLSTPIP
jgi:hypothetical protein